MRLIKLLVSEESRSTVIDILESENIDFVVTKNATERGDTVLVEFPLPTQAVEYVMGELRDAGVDDREYTIIASAETAKTRSYHELEDRFVAGAEEDDAVAREEIRAKALDMHRNPLTYYALTIFSALVAAAGLLMDSPAVVVGAMVIAPQVGSALISAVGISLNDRRMIRMGFTQQLLGFGAAVAGAFLLGMTLKSGQIVTSMLDVSTVGQISKRISPGFLSVLVGLCAGSAGAFGLATALPVSLVGVMIAAALIPAAAAVGIGMAWGLPSVALGAGLLLVVNAVAVNVSAFSVLWYLGYRPEAWDDEARAAMDDGEDGAGSSAERMDDGAGESVSRGVRKYVPAAVALTCLLAVLLGAGGLLFGQVAFDNAANGAVEDVMEQQRYDELDLTSVRTEVGMVRYVGETPEVSVVVVRPVDEPYPALAEAVRQQVQQETDRDVRVSVEFVDGQSAGVDEERSEKLRHPGETRPVGATAATAASV
ncbi:TIGR00341 family protein [Halogeometricum sp. S1BR25-6]|uniref:TIGR00341 family protein n=1 Tax=Halogeometricum salsisoli TaxID=2950536 RepID=A0ABU2GDJ8_9EURY|nr:TIGR00341 family protein [Halogeometricum sp. S1BR25-6]MDS0298891.1 TIGR00341 family protein [Halogeometricum sp. S1BR25-6]